MAGRRVSRLMSVSVAFVVAVAAAVSRPPSPARTGPSGEAPCAPARARRPTPRSSGPRGRTCAGRSTSPASATAARSCRDDLVLVTTAEPSAKDPKALEFVVLALERKDGKLRWRTRRARGGAARGHARRRTATPRRRAVTDGKRDLRVLRLARALRARHDGQARLAEASSATCGCATRFGEGSSPALHGDTLVVNWDHEGADFIVALDKTTGKERWRKPRDEPTRGRRRSWSTRQGRAAGGRRRRRTACVSYDLATGEERLAARAA